MCHYITAALPESADLKKLKRLMNAHRQVLRPVENAFVQAQLPAGAQYLSCTNKHCDCGTALGWLAREEEGSSSAPSLERLRRKGWSEARILRWQEERARAEQKAGRSRAENTPHAEAEAWAAYIRELIASGEAPWFGLLLHWYRGDLEQERIQLAETVELPLRDLDGESLLRLKEDVLYRFRS